MFRSPNEGAPVARRLAELGWQSFVVNYRVRPYTMEEGSLDLARAIRYVRSHAADYGIDSNHIASVASPRAASSVAMKHCTSTMVYTR